MLLLVVKILAVIVLLICLGFIAYLSLIHFSAPTRQY